MLAAVLILAFIRRAVVPNKFSISMHFSFLPISLVLRAIRKNCYAFSLWCQCFFINKAEIFPSISIQNLRLLVRKILKNDSMRFRLVMMIFKYDFSSFWNRVIHYPFKSISVIFTCDLPFAFSSSIFNLALISYLLLK